MYPPHSSYQEVGQKVFYLKQDQNNAMELKVGAHVSISGGFVKALDREEEIGGNCGQVFVHSPRGWGFSELTEEEAENFKAEYQERGWRPLLVHSNYLINLATPKPDLFKKSVETLKEELRRAGKLGMEYVVFHPGSHTGSGEDKGIQSIVQGLNMVKNSIPDGTKLLLENTAGKGTSLGKNAEQLSKMLDRSDLTFKEVGVCFDTCHGFTAGYDLRNREGVEETIAEFEKFIGWENVEAIHLNDSKHPLGSEKDEHEHIGEGEIGESGMRAVLNHPKFREKPLVLETPVDKRKNFKDNLKRVKELAEPL